MVKLKGPAVSTDALGSIADVLCFQKGRRGTIGKKHAKPKQPNTDAQIGVRSNIKWLSQQWSSLTAAQMASWFSRAQLSNVANYHAYLSQNSKRFHNFLMPSKQDPATEAGGGSTMDFNYLTERYKTIRYNARSGGPPVNWGYVLCRSRTSGFTPGPENVITFIQKTASVYDRYYDRGLASGWWYYQCAGFDITGRRIAFFGELGMQLP